jgi:hypothetical protein
MWLMGAGARHRIRLQHMLLVNHWTPDLSCVNDMDALERLHKAPLQT